MAETVLVVVPGLGTLALDRAEFDRARQRGQEMLGVATPAQAHAANDEGLLDAAGLSECLNVPATWVEQAARDGRIPCVKVGRRVRFRRADVEAAISTARSPVPRLRVAK